MMGGARTQVRCFQRVTALSRCFWHALTANPRSTSASVWPPCGRRWPAFVCCFCLCVLLGLFFFCLFVWFKTGFTTAIWKWNSKQRWNEFHLLSFSSAFLFNHLQLEHVVLQFPLKLQKAPDGQFAFQVFSKEVGGECWAAASRLQSVSCGGPVPVSHAHAGLGTNDALNLQGRNGFHVRRDDPFDMAGLQNQAIARLQRLWKKAIFL